MGRCKACSAELENRRRVYCDRCRTPAALRRERERNRRRDRSRDRATYGGAHKKLRRAWAPQVATGTVVCWRCGRLIAAGAKWDLGHDDDDPTVYRGPEHEGCNRATSGRRKVAVVRRTSEAW